MKRFLSILALGLGGIALEGCSAADDGAGENLPSDTAGSSDGLSIVSVDEAAGLLVVDYAKSGRHIQYELRLGPQMETPPSAEELSQNPELPTREVDARVLDGNGQPFVIQMGGDEFSDPSWAMPTVENFDEAGRRADFALMREAVSAFRSIDLPPSLSELRLAAIELGQDEDGAPDKPELADLANSAPEVRPLGNIEHGPSSVVKWDFKVRYKCLVTCAAGHHSAVTLRGWSASNTVVFRAHSSNHGASAASSSMRDRCTMPGFKQDDGTHSRYFYVSGCTTRYNVTSIRGHNCNDDSELQGRAIWQDRTQSTTGGSCNSLGMHNFAPDCTY